MSGRKKDNIISGTKSGGAKAAATNKKRYGDDFYKKNGQKGGKVSGIAKGFALNKDLARKAGKLGGTNSKRGPIKKDTNVQ